MSTSQTPNRIAGPHCQSCGSTAYEDIETAQDPDYQGYSRCCNEIVVGVCDVIAYDRDAETIDIETTCYHR